MIETVSMEMVLALYLSAGLSLLSIYGMVVFFGLQRQSLDEAPRIAPLTDQPTALPLVSVIIPAYNEAVNIQDCIKAVLNSELPNPGDLQILVADDDSTDATKTLAQALADQDDRVQVIAVPPRPQDAVWLGKNWACTQAVSQATGNYLLFIDADVRLAPKAIATAVTQAEQDDIDLLSLVPNILCGCLAEWLVQPVMASILAVGFNFAAVNDPTQSEQAFAAGPFMLFRRAAYDAIGGHQAVADNLVEDVALARLIKQRGHRLYYALGLDLFQVRMYQNWAGLWEGWTKNYYLGAGRNIYSTLYSALSMLVVFTAPWLGLGLALVLISNGGSLIGIATVLLGMGAIVRQYVYRRETAQRFRQPLRYFWLSWLSGLLVAAIAIGSIIKTETGWGWTWRGRPLKVQAQR
ncbi:glycosyltransferase family 2 protein [Halomicronema sp. CCY15110]|uniref:glycosyltransferase n=1 Tax=Halomicronema sp. CCY15110 TaxID=2767773 RepID=UPI001EF34451|nr:glycosyltransferase family 2 protein [Halomicronema sp. CCY15110]